MAIDASKQVVVQNIDDYVVSQKVIFGNTDNVYVGTFDLSGNTQVDSLSSSIQDNSDYITALTSDVTDLAGEIPQIQSDIEQNEGSINAVNTAIARNTANVLEISGKADDSIAAIGNLQGAVADNDTDINTLSGYVLQNDIDIATLSGDVFQNITDISTVSGAVETNRLNILTNNSGIGNLVNITNVQRTDINKNITDIGTLSGDVEQNTNNINNLVGLPSDVTDLVTDLSQVSQDLGVVSADTITNTNNIGTVSADAISNANDIATNLTYIQTVSADDIANAGNIATNLTYIQTVSSDTITNTNDIFTVSGQVDTNTEQISIAYGQIGNNTTVAYANRDNISTVSADTITNTTNISTVSADLIATDVIIDVLSGDVTTNTTSISSLSTSVDNISFVSVKDFGATGDGETDDQPAIQQALQYGLDNGVTIVFPEGRYILKAFEYQAHHLRVFESWGFTGNTIRIVGEGRVQLVSHSSVESTTTLSIAGGLLNCSVENIEFYNENVYPTTVESLVAISLGGASSNNLMYPLVKGCTFDGYSRTISINGCGFPTITQCRFLNTRGRSTGQGTSVPHVGIWCFNNTSGHTIHPTITDNFWTGFGGDNYDPVEGSSASDGLIYGTYVHGATIRGNHIEKFGVEGIFVSPYYQEFDTIISMESSGIISGPELQSGDHIIISSIATPSISAIGEKTEINQFLSVQYSSVVNPDILFDGLDMLLTKLDNPGQVTSGTGRTSTIYPTYPKTIIENNYVDNQPRYISNNGAYSIRSDGSNVIIRNNTINNAYHGVFVYAEEGTGTGLSGKLERPNDIIIENNTITTLDQNFSSRAIYIGGPNDYNNVVIRGNTIIKDMTPGSHTHTADLYAIGLNRTHTGLIEDNYIYCLNHDISEPKPLMGIVTALSEDIVIKNNTIIGTGYAIDVSSIVNSSSPKWIDNYVDTLSGFFAPGSLAVERTLPGGIARASSAGNATQNTEAGSVIIGAGTDTVRVTNELVTADSIIMAQVASTDATILYIVSVVAGAGYFDLTGYADATADTTVNWRII
jgi:hypothetical protein